MSKSLTSNQLIPILLYLLAAIAGAFGQYFYKLGGLQFNSVPLYRNVSLFAGVLLFCLVMVLFVAAFRLGGRISIVYPVYATTFIWGILIATTLAKEPFSMLQLLGAIIILFGVSLIAVGGAAA